MRAAEWKDIAELVGILAIVASLIFVGLQMQQTQTLAAGEAYAITGATRVNVDQVLIDNADIWVRGSSGEELDSTESFVFSTQIDAETTWHFTSYMQAIAAGSASEAADLLFQFATLLRRNPGAELIFLAEPANVDSSASVRGVEEGDYTHFIGLVREELDMLNEARD